MAVTIYMLLETENSWYGKLIRKLQVNEHRSLQERQIAA